MRFRIVDRWFLGVDFCGTTDRGGVISGAEPAIFGRRRIDDPGARFRRTLPRGVGVGQIRGEAGSDAHGPGHRERRSGAAISLNQARTPL